MRQHDAARCASGSRGINQTRQPLRRNLPGFGRDIVRRRGVGEHFVPALSANFQQQVQAAHFFSRRPDTVRQRAFRGDDRAGSAVPQDVCVIVNGVGGVGWHRNGADSHQRDLGDQIIRPIFRANHHPVTRRHSLCAQVPRTGCRHTAIFSPGDGEPGIIAEGTQKGFSRPFLGEVQHHRGQIWPCGIALHGSFPSEFLRSGIKPFMAAVPTLHLFRP